MDKSSKLGLVFGKYEPPLLRAERRKKASRRRKMFKEKGLCLCGQKPDPDKKMCTRCLESRLAIYHRRKEEGVCVYCGLDRGERKNFTSCEICNKKRNDARKEKREKQ